MEERTRKMASLQSSLIQANAYLQQIINLFKEPLQVLEPVFENDKIVDFRFKMTNEAFAAYANTTPEKLRGKRVGEVFPGYYQTSSFTKPIETFLTGKPDTWELHYNQDGLDLYNLMSATKLNNDVVVHFTDFTKLKHLQLQLLEKIEQLERSNANLADFGYALSHDLKEPLRKIQMFVDRFIEEHQSMGEESFGFLFKVQHAASRMGNLIDGLMAFSNINSNSAEREDVDLNQCLQEALDDLELDIQQKRAKINIHKLPVVRGYGLQLQQMFQNLVGNALKYSRSDARPEIEIRSDVAEEKGKRYHMVEVKDNGIGFDQKFADQIFRMFSRLHDKNSYTGNGIGLSIVKRVAENHDGLVQAQGMPGSGAAFRVLLPLEDEHADPIDH